MANPNQRVRLNSMDFPVALDPETVQSLVDEFFKFNGDSEEVEKTLWRMFDGSISNPEYPTEPAENGNMAHLYKMLSELVRDLEKFKSKPYIELSEN